MTTIHSPTRGHLRANLRLNASLHEGLADRSPEDRLMCGAPLREAPPTRAGALSRALVGDCQGAERALRVALLSHPGDRYSNIWLAQVLLGLGRREESVAVWTRTAGAELLLERSRLAYKKERDAEGKFWAALTLESLSRADTAFKLAGLSRTHRDRALGLKATEKAIALSSPEEATFWQAKGLRAHMQGQRLRAEEAFLEGLRLDPSHAYSWRIVRTLQESRGAYAEAFETSRNLAYLQPSRDVWWIQMARFSARMGKTAEAEVWMEKARSVGAGPGWKIELAVAEAICASDGPEQASGLYTSSLETSGRAFEVLHSLGGCSLRAGRHEEALSYFREAVDRAPDPPSRQDVLLSLAQTHTALKNPQQAIRNYELILELSPEHPTARRRLDGLRGQP